MTTKMNANMTAALEAIRAAGGRVDMNDRAALPVGAATIRALARRGALVLANEPGPVAGGGYVFPVYEVRS